MESQFKFRDWIQPAFYYFADFLSIPVRSVQSHDFSGIGNSKNQCSAKSIGKCAHSFTPAFGFFHLKELFFIIFRCFSNQIFYFHIFQPSLTLFLPSTKYLFFFDSFHPCR